jgi:O-antigen/teichoic acid export membrane protein
MYKIRTVTINYIAQLVNIALQIIFIPIFLNRFGAEEFAFIALLNLVIALFGILDMVTNSITVSVGSEKYVSENKKDYYNFCLISETVFTYILLSIFITLVFILFMTDGVWLKLNRETTYSDKFLLLSIILIAIMKIYESLYRSLLYVSNQVPAFSLALILQSLMKNPITYIFLVLIEGDIYMYFFVQTCAVACYLCVIRIMAVSFVKPLIISRKTFLDYFRRSKSLVIGVTLIGITGAIISQIDKVFISGHLSAADLTIYSIAFTGSSLILAIASPIAQLSFPDICKSKDTGEIKSIGKTFIWYSTLVGGVVFFCGSLLYHSADYILELWLGETKNFAQILSTFKILVIANLLCGIVLPVYHLQIACKFFVFPIITNIFAMLSLATYYIVFKDILNLEHVALAYLSTFILYFFVTTPIAIMCILTIRVMLEWLVKVCLFLVLGGLLTSAIINSFDFIRITLPGNSVNYLILGIFVNAIIISLISVSYLLCFNKVIDDEDDKIV